MNDIILKTTNFLAKFVNAEPQSDKYAILKYGVELFFLNLYKTIILIILAVILGIWKEVLIFGIAYGILRSYAFGIHIDSGVGCTIWGLAYYIGSSYLARYIKISFGMLIWVYTILILIFLLHAPSGTKKRPVGKIEKKHLKTISLLLLIIMYLLSVHVIGSGIIINLIMLAAVCEAINIMPITYRIFKQERGEISNEKVD